MSLRLNWLFIVFIYLSVNGQVFATASHICPQMALSSTALSTTLSTAKQPINIHEHHQKTTHPKEVNHNGMAHDMSNSPSKTDLQAMQDCQCVDCDCVQNVAGQANNLLIQETELISYLPALTTILIKPAQIFISQPHSNLFRPPITA